MPEDFLVPLDIANRALQHCGATRITSFDQDHKNADAVDFCYDKLRRAELRRNVWRYAIRKCILRPIDPDTTLALVPSAWDVTKAYPVGAIVLFSGVLYSAVRATAVAQSPETTPASWDRYFGSVVAQLWDSDEAYGPGEVVYTPATSAGHAYLSLASANADDPTATAAYDATVTYRKGDTVTYSAVVYQSTTDLNVATTPTGSAPWITVPATQSGRRMGRNWLRLDGCSYETVTSPYPLAAGPTVRDRSRYIYRLPAGFLREAPQAPKSGSSSFLGGPSGEAYSDWDFEGDYFTSRASVGPIVFRFVADIDSVLAMDSMFCEGLACRIALEVCEDLTQSSDKLRNIGAAYARFMSEARTVNGIETGPTEPPEDDFITCRV